jgi:hypothetical protein
VSRRAHAGGMLPTGTAAPLAVPVTMNAGADVPVPAQAHGKPHSPTSPGLGVPRATLLVALDRTLLD